MLNVSKQKSLNQLVSKNKRKMKLRDIRESEHGTLYKQFQELKYKPVIPIGTKAGGTNKHRVRIPDELYENFRIAICKHLKIDPYLINDKHINMVMKELINIFIDNYKSNR